MKILGVNSSARVLNVCEAPQGVQYDLIKESINQCSLRPVNETPWFLQTRLVSEWRMLPLCCTVYPRRASLIISSAPEERKNECVQEGPPAGREDPVHEWRALQVARPFVSSSEKCVTEQVLRLTLVFALLDGLSRLEAVFFVLKPLGSVTLRYSSLAWPFTPGGLVWLFPAHRKSVRTSVYRRGPPQGGRILFTSDALCR